MCFCFLQFFFSCNWYIVLIALWLEKMLDMNSIFLNLLRFDLWPKTWSILENVPFALEKVYSSGFGWNVLKISMRSSSSNVSFKTCVSLIFSVLMICPLMWAGYWSLLLLLCYCQFLLLCLLCCLFDKHLYVLRWSYVGFISSVQSLSRVRLFVTPWIAAHQTSLSITNFRSLLKFISVESVMPPTISSFVVPFSSCLQSFPASGSFAVSQFFASGGQSIGVSALASVLPVNI